MEHFGQLSFLFSIKSYKLFVKSLKKVIPSLKDELKNHKYNLWNNFFESVHLLCGRSTILVMVTLTAWQRSNFGGTGPSRKETWVSVYFHIFQTPISFLLFLVRKVSNYFYFGVWRVGGRVQRPESAITVENWDKRLQDDENTNREERVAFAKKK